MSKVDFICNMIMKYSLCNIYKLTRAMELGKCLELYGYIACKITLRILREQYIFFIAWLSSSSVDIKVYRLFRIPFKMGLKFKIDKTNV